MRFTMLQKYNISIDNQNFFHKILVVNRNVRHDRYKMRKKYIGPLLGRNPEMTLPETPNSPAQRYVLEEEGEDA